MVSYVNAVKSMVRFEVGIGTFFTLMGIVLMIEGIKKHDYLVALVSVLILCGYGVLCFFAVRENLKKISGVKK